MLIDKSVQPYIVFFEDTIVNALNKISANKSRIVFAVNENGVVAGSLSDGDFRRWITQQTDIDLNIPVADIVNRDFLFKRIDDDASDIETIFSSGINIVPLLDRSGRIVAISKNTEKGIAIGARIISEDSPCFIISEIGNNHNGSLDLAKQLIDLSIEAGADCCKFQMRDMASLYVNPGLQDNSADLGAEYTLELLGKFQLSREELFEAFDYCKSRGSIPLCTPWDKKSLENLEEYGLPAYKVASADLTNHGLLESIAGTGKPMICSTGMSTEDEILEAVKLLHNLGAQFILLHCNSTYPTPFKDVHLNYLNRLSKISGGIVGYSGHERGIAIPVAAVAKGAKIVEKHFTLDRNMEGNDHKVSLLPEEFKMMVGDIRSVEASLGEITERNLTQGEMMNREVLAKSLFINRAIKAGTVITRDMIDIMSPGQGLQPYHLHSVVGSVAKRDFAIGDCFFRSDIETTGVAARDYHFDRPLGIPVRFHDYAELVSKSNLDFIEFHLSYRDMGLELENFLDGEQAIGFAVHSPELFSEDHIMDLCSVDDIYRQRSVDELQRVVDVTRSLKGFFPATQTPVIVINAGGHSKTGMMAASDRKPLYDLVAESLSKVDQEGVEITIQTMPPFPWHFGGQSYHNLFMCADEIMEFYRQYGYRCTLDISHSKLACNYFKWDFDSFVEKVGPATAHLHIVDAEGVDGEGVQIGTGDVDFESLGKILNKHAPGIQFIPEIWQGHKNGGEGFWHALDLLERYL